MGQLTKAVNAGRPPEKIALHLVAKLGLEKLKLGGRLHALSKYRKIERPPEPKHRANDRGSLVVDVDRLDEGAVDLDFVERKRPQIRQRRITGTEVVHGDANAEHLDSAQCCERAIQVAHQRRLGNLQLEPRRGESGLEQ